MKEIACWVLPSFVLGFLFAVGFLYLPEWYPGQHGLQITTLREKYIKCLKQGENEVAETLYNKVSLLCWIPVKPENIPEQVSHIHETWGHRCSKLIFMSTTAYSELGVIKLPVTKCKNKLWALTKEAYRYIYKNHLKDYDWILKAEIETYVVVENLRKLLSAHDPNHPIYMGHRLKHENLKQGFMNAGPGYVINRSALKKLVEEGLDNPLICQQEPDGAEDQKMGGCMEKLGISAGDSRDGEQLDTFLPFTPEYHLVPGFLPETHWIWDKSYYRNEVGSSCCSNHAISFHFVPSNMMHVLDYLIYGPNQRGQGIPQSTKGSLLCWVMTHPENHHKKAKHVRDTWGKHCTKLLFMSSQADTELGIVALPVGEGRDNLWAKTKAAYRYIYKNHLNDADWILKADDDTFVIVENLIKLLSQYEPSQPIFLGRRFISEYLKQGFMSGGAGYVINKNALKKLVEVGLDNPLICRQEPNGAEDLEMGGCMEKLGIPAGDTRDEDGRETFFPFPPEHYLVPGFLPKTHWIWGMDYFKSEIGPNCCSSRAVSFHYITPNMMHVFDYLIYHLRPYGLIKC